MSNSETPIKEDSLNGVTEDKSDEIVEHFESNPGAPIKEDSSNGVTEYKSDEHLETTSDAQIKEDS